jgi:hypothetical protein
VKLPSGQSLAIGPVASRARALGHNPGREASAASRWAASLSFERVIREADEVSDSEGSSGALRFGEE